MKEELLTQEQFISSINDIVEQVIGEDIKTLQCLFLKVGITTWAEEDYLYADCPKCGNKVGLKVINRTEQLYWTCFNPHCKHKAYNKTTGFIPYMTGMSLAASNNCLIDNLFCQKTRTTKTIDCATSKYKHLPFHEIAPNKLLWLAKCFKNIYNRKEIIDYLYANAINGKTKPPITSIVKTEEEKTANAEKIAPVKKPKLSTGDKTKSALEREIAEYVNDLQNGRQLPFIGEWAKAILIKEHGAKTDEYGDLYLE